jgi:MFS family permease
MAYYKCLEDSARSACGKFTGSAKERLSFSFHDYRSGYDTIMDSGRTYDVYPFYAGQLVFLLGGAIGTLGGAILSDCYGHKRFLVLSLLFTTLVFPLLFFFTGLLLFIILGVIRAMLISPCTATIVMAQKLLPKHLGLVSGLMAGFAIGTGCMGVTLLGIIADYFGIPAALQSLTVPAANWSWHKPFHSLPP